jgi:hypothetical protein
VGMSLSYGYYRRKIKQEIRASNEVSFWWCAPHPRVVLDNAGRSWYVSFDVIRAVRKSERSEAQWQSTVFKSR